MDDLYNKIFERYGLPGLIIIYLVGKFIKEWFEERKEKLEIEAKKKSGEWVSYDDIRALQKKVDDYLIKEAQKDILAAQLRTEFDSHKALMIVETDHIFSQLKSLHEKFDSRFDLLTKMIVERK